MLLRSSRGCGNLIHNYRCLRTVNEDLSYDHTKIVKVYRSSELGLLTSCEVIQNRFLLWEDNMKEMTLADIERALGHKVKIVE